LLVVCNQKPEINKKELLLMFFLKIVGNYKEKIYLCKPKRNSDNQIVKQPIKELDK